MPSYVLNRLPYDNSTLQPTELRRRQLLKKKIVKRYVLRNVNMKFLTTTVFNPFCLILSDFIFHLTLLIDSAI